MHNNLPLDAGGDDDAYEVLTANDIDPHDIIEKREAAEKGSEDKLEGPAPSWVVSVCGKEFGAGGRRGPRVLAKAGVGREGKECVRRAPAAGDCSSGVAAEGRPGAGGWQLGGRLGGRLQGGSPWGGGGRWRLGESAAAGYTPKSEDASGGNDEDDGVEP